MSKKTNPPQDEVELTAEWFTRAKPAREVLPAAFMAAASRGRGRPKAAPDEKKIQVTLRLDPLIIGFYRGQGEGWQRRLNDDLVELVLNGKKEGVGRSAPSRGHFGGLVSPGVSGKFVAKKAAAKSAKFAPAKVGVERDSKTGKLLPKAKASRSGVSRAAKRA